MYSAKPLGINIKDNDYDVSDGFLRESINMQWRDSAFRPVPERLISEIDTTGYSGIILHKVSDENQINVLGFKDDAPNKDVLYWFGTITDGVYASITPVTAWITRTSGMSFTILNGLIYFMGDGSETAEQYYHRIQFIESTGIYEYKNMYAWKALIPFYPFQSNIEMVAPKNTVNVFSQCGVILIRCAIVLKSGEIVLHSPIYPFLLFGLNRDDATIVKGSTIENIHCLINMDLSYIDSSLLNQEISAINFYATTPFYESSLTTNYSGSYDSATLLTSETITGQLQIKAQEPFYLIKTIQTPAASTEKILLSVGQMDIDITFTSVTTSKIDISTIAAGEIMPVDNFSYHYVYGEITSNNGRIIINKPTTVLSGGHIRSLATEAVASDVGFRISTEDGNLSGIAYVIDKALKFNDGGWGTQVRPRGILSYPDGRATFVGGSTVADGVLRLFKTKNNELHNMACAFNISSAGFSSFSFAIDGANVEALTDYNCFIIYSGYDEVTATNQPIVQAKYNSLNRVQFSEAGEFSVWPAINSYRIGEGKIMAIGANSVNPADTLTVAPLIAGTSDGVYTFNYDQSGNTLGYFTKTASTPYISKETLQIGDQLLFISDKGLMAFNGGEPKSLTEDFFPDQGNGNFPSNETVFPNYNLITTRYFGGTGNPYTISDIVEYLKDALLAYDSRRGVIWCSNPNKTYSLTYDVKNGTWGINTLVFNERIELFSIITTDEGDIYSRYLVKKSGEDNLLILSGEDSTKEVEWHILTRPIKLQNPDAYKRIDRVISRCELFRKNTGTGYFVFGLWGKQDANKNKENIPIIAIDDISSGSFPSNVRQDIPIGSQKGKYKFITILQGGKSLPESSIDRFDIEAYLVDEKQLR
jgi:hypothetical protein